MTPEDANRRERLLCELTAKLGEYRDAARHSKHGSRASPASAMDLNRLSLDVLMRLHREIADLTTEIESLPRPGGSAVNEQRAQLARQLREAEQALEGAAGEDDEERRSALALEVRHLSLLVDLT